MKRSPHSPQLEKACAKQWKPSTAKKKKRKETNIWALGATVISLFLGPFGKQSLETPPYTHLFLYYKTWVHTNATIVQLHRINSRLLTAHIRNSLSSKVGILTAHLPDTYLLPCPVSSSPTTCLSRPVPWLEIKKKKNRKENRTEKQGRGECITFLLLL